MRTKIILTVMFTSLIYVLVEPLFIENYDSEEEIALRLYAEFKNVRHKETLKSYIRMNSDRFRLIAAANQKKRLRVLEINGEEVEVYSSEMLGLNDYNSVRDLYVTVYVDAFLYFDEQDMLIKIVVRKDSDIVLI